MNLEKLEMAYKFAELPEGSKLRGNIDNTFYFSVPTRGVGVTVTSYDGKTTEVNEDTIVVEVEDNTVTVIDKMIEGWREYRDNDPMPFIVEYTINNTLTTKYHVVEKAGHKYLISRTECNESSEGLHDSYGGEKGNGYNTTYFTETKMAKVPSDYKLSDGLKNVEFKAKIKKIK